MTKELRNQYSVCAGKFELPDALLWRTVKIASVVLLLIGCAVLTDTARYRYDKNHLLRILTEESNQLAVQKNELSVQSNELTQTKLRLLQTTQLLVSAENKLGYLNQHKTAVQVTAFTGQGHFANGVKTAHSYAVPNRVLPEDKVLNIALSPAAQHNLHARMNDYIVLLDKSQEKARLARFVDTTSANEHRPVVDVFFARQEEALRFGRQDYLAVNISEHNSPFQEE